MGNMFRIQRPTFERTMVGFVKILAPHSYTVYVESVQKKHTWDKLEDEDELFDKFKFAVDAVDVTFQQSNRPSGLMRDGCYYFSGKHHLYGFKMEVSVRLNGLALDVSNHYGGSVSEIVIMQERSAKQRERCRKHGPELTYEDECILHDKYLFLETRATKGRQNFCSVSLQ